ncbi:putative nucleotide-binding alpha-beta plait domain-containing protein [Rosa chinensis]|uniref:Putative nucleotide-binding alpha-beta plait domain-containing protein n=1 Tax=Rosa chinensis TaxID=74649 RepID=A0A2P6SP80_ROSCH|nr:RNA-binding protein 2 [Rosa chinensis]PRQ60494.1 putative nucleotide-binding alpha-beta plait domain-containing protein [Rosa chinensis]
MADAYWRYSDGRQPPPSGMNSGMGKRPRPDYDSHSGHDLPGYYPHEDDRGSLRAMRDTDSINASYDRYLRSAQMSSYSGGQSARNMSGGLPGRSVDDPRMMGMVEPGPVKERVLGLGSGRPEVPLPPGATSTLFVEGLPANCTRREVAHIFRPFVGYKEVRLVSKESRHPGGEPLVLCFVDFMSPAHAATAMDALQGYTFDEHDRDSVNLRLQFARYPGARSGGGHRGKR